MRRAFLTVFLIGILFPGCRAFRKETALENGVAEIEVARSFDVLFPEAEHQISYYSGTKGDPIWTSKVGLHGRYVLSVEFGISFDESGTHPVRHGEPVFHLRELCDIRERGTSYTKRQMSFGMKEWRLVVESLGDFSVIGYPMTKDEPLEGFDEALRW